MRNAQEILNDAHRILGDECTDYDNFVRSIRITRDDIYDGKPIIGIHYSGKLVQYWVTYNDISKLERIINGQC
jgi:hypothetical protein